MLIRVQDNRKRPPLLPTARLEGDLYSESAQKAVLGSALLDNSLMRGAIATLAVDDFVGSADRLIYTQILEFSEDGKPFDALTVAQALEDRGELERAGGYAYISSLVDGAVPEPGLVKQHAERIQKLSHLRRLSSFGEVLVRNTKEPGAEPDLLYEEAEKGLRSLRAGYDLDGNLLLSGPSDLSRRPEILTLSQVEAQEVEWLWKLYLAFGMLSMLSGDPGAGKTFIALAIAASVTAGRMPYSCEPCKPGDVLYLSVENSPEHVLRPRFDALRGDPSRFHILQGSVTGEGNRAEHGCVRLSDVPLLEEAVKRTQAQLIIVDPIQSYLGAEVDAHRSNETRPVLDGLSRLAARRRCCILLVRHLSKAQSSRAIHRGLGSIDLTGAVRTELLAGCTADDPTQRALVQVKSNIGQFGPSLGFSIDEDAAFKWTGESVLTACEILSPESTEEDKSALEEATEFLKHTLRERPRLVTEVKAEARQAGVKERTLKRAKTLLGVTSTKQGMDGAWEWSLPEGSQR